MRFIFLLLISISLTYADTFKDAISKINHIRASSGEAKLRYDARLRKAAYRHARYLGVNRANGHTEKQNYPEFSGTTPSNRIVASNYHTKAVVENISFGERSYSSSIETLMATIYHRHGFLDFRVDSIGAARAGRIRSVFVYDMSLSTLDKLCKSTFNTSDREYVYNICANPNKKISKSRFLNIIKSIERKSKPIIVYPYPNQKSIPHKYRKERPNPIPYIPNAGYPISILFNPSYYNHIKLKSFTLKKVNGKYIKGKILTSKNDRYHKLSHNIFVFIPTSPLAKGTYEARFKGVADGRYIDKKWRFSTK